VGWGFVFLFLVLGFCFVLCFGFDVL